MPLRVSVIVPVYNAAAFIDRAVESVAAQTMPPEDMELICVDDGSTDDSLARLRELEAVHPRLRAITIPPSGWPGRPRNVGTDAATGEYVMYLDQDDILGPEALERMYRLGANHAADVVLGKVTSDFRGVHPYLYRENRSSCTVFDARLMNSQTPHKMLRREFLAEHGIRFPEGRRRLEDQLFITEAYLAARSCAIVADYVCYRYLRRPDRKNAGSQPTDPWAYLDNLREVLDVIDAQTPPGSVRDEFYRRFLRVEVLGKLSGRQIVNTPLDRGDRWLVPLRELANERFPTTVDEGLPTLTRLRSRLLRHGTFADLKKLTLRTRELQPDVLLEIVSSDDGTARLRLAGGLVLKDAALEFEADGKGGWLLPPSVTGPDVTPELRGVDLSDATADVVVISRDQHDEWFVDRPLSVSLEVRDGVARPRITGEVTLNATSAAGGRPLAPGRHALSVRLNALGLSRVRPLRLVSHTGGAMAVAVLSVRPCTVLVANRAGNASLEVQVSGKAVRRAVTPIKAAWQGDRIVMELATDWLATDVLRAELISSRGHSITLSMTRAEEPQTWQSGPEAVHPGSYHVRLSLPRAGVVEAAAPIVVPLSARRLIRAARGRTRAGLVRLRGRLGRGGRGARSR